MRFLLVFVFACWGSLAGAQEAGTKLIDRTTGKPDMERVSSMQGKPFEGSGNVTIKKAGAFDRAVGGEGTFQTGAYPMTRSFFGIKNPWFGAKVPDVKPAKMHTDFVIPNLQREVETKALLDNRPAFDENRSANLRDEPVKTKAHTPQAGAQGAMDVFGEKARKEMSIEDIREILNKK